MLVKLVWPNQRILLDAFFLIFVTLSHFQKRPYERCCKIRLGLGLGPAKFKINKLSKWKIGKRINSK